MTVKKLQPNTDANWSKAIFASRKLMESQDQDNRAIGTAINQYSQCELIVLVSVIEGLNDVLERLDRLETAILGPGIYRGPLR